MTDSTDTSGPPTSTERWPPSRNEILDVMADEGYSADSRKAWLKVVLTRISQEQETDPDPEREYLMKEIKEILHVQVSAKPEADDTL